MGSEATIDAGTMVLMVGATSPNLFTILPGMGMRQKTLEDGQRQVVSFVFPGDFIRVRAAIPGETKHLLEANAPMGLCVFNRSDRWDMFKNHPTPGL